MKLAAWTVAGLGLAMAATAALPIWTTILAATLVVGAASVATTPTLRRRLAPLALALLVATLLSIAPMAARLLS